MCRGGKGGEGRCIKDPEFYFEHINSVLPICSPNGDIRNIVSCRPMSLCTVLVKSTASGAGTSGVESQIHSSSEPHSLGLLVWKVG